MQIAWFNVEKVGQSSPQIKETIVSDFLDWCLRDLGVDLCILLEIHNVRVADIARHIEATVQGYTIGSVFGGHSNHYVYAFKTATALHLGDTPLLGLNRSCAGFSITDPARGSVVRCELAHFKSGQLPLTRRQIGDVAEAASHLSGGTWVVGGDLNWDFAHRAALELPPGTQAFSYWDDATQRQGNILDWALYSPNLRLSRVGDIRLQRDLHEYREMQGPDHKPVVLRIDFTAPDPARSATGEPPAKRRRFGPT